MLWAWRTSCGQHARKSALLPLNSEGESADKFKSSRNLQDLGPAAVAMAAELTEMLQKEIEPGTVCNLDTETRDVGNVLKPNQFGLVHDRL